MNHCLAELSRNQLSLQVGLECLSHQLWPVVVKSISTQSSHSSLARSQLKELVSQWSEHFFLQFIRLRDGLILCISGECRHKGNIQRARQQSIFQSELGRQDTHHCSDGYTKLYSSSCTYNGASWDEWMDPQVGLQSRLLRMIQRYVPASQRDTLWEQLVEDGPLEAILSQIEVQRQQIQEEFNSISKQVCTELTKLLPGLRVDISFADKMERMQLTWGKWTYDVMRRGNNFQIPDDRGVLPDAKDWDGIMSKLELLPRHSKNKTQSFVSTTNVKKRRRILDDDNDENKIILNKHDSTLSSIQGASLTENHPNDKAGSQVGVVMAPAVAGLVVRVSEGPDYDVEESATSSLNRIKETMGADVERLASAREMLEAEEAATFEAAAAVDDVPLSNPEGTMQAIREAEGKVKTLKRLVKRSLKKDIVDHSEIWDAQECLREAQMEAGNLLLWYSPPDGRGRRKLLDKAIHHFEESKTLVLSQQLLCDEMNPVSNPTSRYIQRSLVLLLGRAQVNVGIALVELGLQCGEIGKDRKLALREAAKEIDSASTSADRLRMLVEADASLDYDADSSGDVFASQTLHILASRWKATALWHLGNHYDSFLTLKNAESQAMTVIEAYRTPNETVRLTQTELVEEIYYAWLTMADLASATLEKATISSIREHPAIHEQALSYARHGIERAVDHSIYLREARDWSKICTVDGVLASEALVDILNEIERWWQQKKEATRKLQLDKDTPGNVQHLIDICEAIDPLPKRIFTVKEAARNSRKVQSRSGRSSGTFPLNDRSNRPALTSQKYRPWGDDFLPMTKDEYGQLVPKLIYPSVAPEMPPEIQSLLNEAKHVD